MAYGTPLSDTGAIRITQIKSGIGTKPKHRGTLRALGLHGIGTTNTLPDRAEIRGMVARVPHLIRVESASPEGIVPARRKTPASVTGTDGAASTKES